MPEHPRESSVPLDSAIVIAADRYARTPTPENRDAMKAAIRALVDSHLTPDEAETVRLVIREDVIREVVETLLARNPLPYPYSADAADFIEREFGASQRSRDTPNGAS